MIYKGTTSYDSLTEYLWNEVEMQVHHRSTGSSIIQFENV